MHVHIQWQIEPLSENFVVFSVGSSIPKNNHLNIVFVNVKHDIPFITYVRNLKSYLNK